MGAIEAAAAAAKIGFLEHFESLEDPRQEKKVLYPLDEVLLLALCAVICGAEGWVEVAAFGRKRLEFLRRFMPYEEGTPSHDQLGLIFAALDAKRFQQCFIGWAEGLKSALGGVIAIDGKTLRRSFGKGGRQGAIHMISAWCSGQRLVLGQAQVDGKSNEITAIPELLKLLTLKGAIVTIDAMGCQREIAAAIIDREADYILALKGNQGRLREDVELFFREQKARGFADASVDRHETADKDHGRLETRRVTVCTDIAWLQERHDWPGLQAIIMVEYAASGGADRCETRYYIASRAASAAVLAGAIRQHWGIENGLHWTLDVTFRDDDCRIRTKNAPANFVTVKHMAINLLRASKGKESMQLKRHLAAWDQEFLYEIIAG